MSVRMILVAARSLTWYVGKVVLLVGSPGHPPPMAVFKMRYHETGQITKSSDVRLRFVRTCWNPCSNHQPSCRRLSIHPTPAKSNHALQQRVPHVRWVRLSAILNFHVQGERTVHRASYNGHDNGSQRGCTTDLSVDNKSNVLG